MSQAVAERPGRRVYRPHPDGRGEIRDTIRTAIDSLVSEQFTEEANLTNLRYHVEHSRRLKDVPMIHGHLANAANHLQHVVAANIDIGIQVETLRANFAALEKLLDAQTTDSTETPTIKSCSRCKQWDVELVEIAGEPVCPGCVHELGLAWQI